MGEGPAKPQDVQVIAVIGAGVLGRGIAQAVALGGYRTILEDLLPNTLRQAQTEIRRNLDVAATRGEVSQAKADSAYRQIEYAGSLEDAARAADLVIEAIADELESKIEIFTLLDKICRPHTILVTNTFSLSVSEIASVTFRRERCVGMRLFQPGQWVPRVEIIRARATNNDTLATAVAVGGRIAREVIVVDESSPPSPPAGSEIPARGA